MWRRAQVDLYCGSPLVSFLTSRRILRASTILLQLLHRRTAVAPDHRPVSSPRQLTESGGNDMRYSIQVLTVATLSLGALAAQPRRAFRGSLSPQAQPQYDRGPVELDTRLDQMSMMLRRTAEQQTSLDQLLAEQQDPKSPRYHQWLTPEQFADRFGASEEEIDKLVDWLQSSGFTITQVARGRDYVAFEGSAGQVESALHARI